MFSWSDRSIELMRDASEYGEYYSLLSRRISPIIKGKRVLDAGCGLGYLSVEMAALCEHVTAADREKRALDVLRQNVAARDIGNIAIIEGDIFTYEPEKPYDVIVFCFFGGIDESLRLAKKCLKPHGKAVLIKKAWERHRFTLSGKALAGHTLAKAEERLSELNVPYTLETLELEMGQPVKSAAEAAEFFSIYDADGATISEADIIDKLVSIDHAKYRFYLPSKKQIGIIELEMGDVPFKIN